MDLFDVVRACFRRWYVILPLLLIVGWYSHNVYTSVRPTYYSNAVLSIAPPSFTVAQNLDGAPIPRNGLLDVGGPTLITNLTSLGLRDPSVVAQVVAGGGLPGYVTRIFPVPANSPELPLIMVEASADDAASAEKTVELVVGQADSIMLTVQQQAGVPEDQMVKIFVASPPSPPVAGIPSRTRATVSILAGGFGIAVLIGLLVDVLVMRWKARRRRLKDVNTTRAGEPDSAASDGRVHAAVNRHAADKAVLESR